MKQIYSHIKLAAVSLLIFSACTQDEMLPQIGENETAVSDVLTIQNVNVANFDTGNSTTRVINDGVTVTFEVGNSLEDVNGDEIGILLIDKDGIGFANEPFKYINENGANKWVSKNSVSYTNKIKKVIAYFPYAQIVKDGKEFVPSSVNELKELKKEEETTEFKDKDLLIAEINDIQSHQLTINFKHAFSLIAFSAEATIKLDDTEEISYLLDLSDVSFSIGDELYTPESMSGKYICLVDEEQLVKNDFRYFYTIDNITYSKTLKDPITLAANQCYTFPCPTSSEGTADIAVGDFYCTTESNKTIILPRNAAGIPTGLTCKGIVFHIIDDFETFKSTNDLNDSNLNGYQEKHGLVVSTKKGNNFGTVAAADIEQAFIYGNAEKYTDTETSNGYKLTQILVGTENLGFIALNNHTEKLNNSTAWYAPSFNELKYLIQGENTQTGSTSGQEYINKQLKKINADELAGTIPSVTFYNGVGDHGLRLMTGGSENGWHGIPSEVFYPICAF